MRTERFALMALVVLLCLQCFPVSAEWPHDPGENLVIVDESATERYQKLTTDGEGGAIIVWEDYRSGNGDIYAQRVTHDGDVLWTDDGVLICSAAWTQQYPLIVSDGAGGAIIAWTDFRTGTDYDVYAQRLDSGGNVLWTADGVAICTTQGIYEEGLGITADGAGGAVMAWADQRYMAGRDIFAQRVDANGNVLWTAGGVPVVTTAGDQTYPQLVGDGSGGAMIVWNDAADIYAQHLDSSGNPVWGINLPVCTNAFAQYAMQVVGDGYEGVIVTWVDHRAGNGDIYGQRFNRVGSTHWTVDGVAICSATGAQDFPQVVADGEGGAIFTWIDGRATGPDIYAQRVSSWGSPLWTADGVLLSMTALPDYYARMVEDGAGGAIVTWNRDGGADRDIMAQRVDGSGAVLWPTGGVVVSQAPDDQDSAEPVSDGAGGAIVVWEDLRTTFPNDLYAQRIERNGYLGFPSPTITEVIDYPGDQGGMAVVSWEPSYLDEYPIEVVRDYSIWRRMPGREGSGGAAGAEMADESIAGATDAAAATPGYMDILPRSGWSYVGEVAASYWDEYAYDAPTYGDSTAAGTPWTEFMVVANTGDHWIFWESEPDSGYSVDNLAPGGPIALDAQAVTANVELTWSPSHYHDEDLDFYNVYRSDMSGFIPGGTNFIGTAADTLYTDVEPGAGPWYYLVSAEDVHGNESEPSNEATASPWTGVDDPVIPVAFALRGNFPNPFNPSTRITFDLPEAVSVRLDVYSAAGHRVATLENAVFEAGTHHVTWRGLNEEGREVPSGVYFARLRAGEDVAEHKMVLLK